MTMNEKRLVVVTALLLVVLIVKSVVFDPNLGKLSVEQNEFVEAVTTTMDEMYDDKFMYKSTLLIARIVKVQDLNADEVAKFEVEESIELNYHYKAKVRKYFLWVIPIGEITLMK